MLYVVPIIAFIVDRFHLLQPLYFIEKINKHNVLRTGKPKSEYSYNSYQITLYISNLGPFERKSATQKHSCMYSSIAVIYETKHKFLLVSALPWHLNQNTIQSPLISARENILLRYTILYET